MCGIVGCLALALEADPDQNWVHTATERITHRGPDDEGFYSDPDVALGFRRLAIIDLLPAATSRCGPLTAATGWSTTVRSTTTSSWPGTAAAGRGPAPDLGLRGAAGDVRPGGQGSGSPAARHVRVRDLGHVDPGAVLRPGPVRDQAVLLPEDPPPDHARLAGAGSSRRGCPAAARPPAAPRGTPARPAGTRPAGRPGSAPRRRAVAGRAVRAGNPGGTAGVRRPPTGRPGPAGWDRAALGSPAPGRPGRWRHRPAAPVRFGTQVPGQSR